MTDLRTVILLCVAFSVLLLTGVVSLHEKHYARRRLTILEARLRTLEGIITEDRTI